MDWKNLFKKKCKHDPDMFMKIETGRMSVLNEENEREIKIVMIYVRCTKCNEILKLTPGGIAHDPINGVFMKTDAKTEIHANLSELEKQQLLEELELV